MISDKLLDWYSDHKRDLPWRHTTDPYTIWISEIILQQTQVIQGLPYFFRFKKAFPTVVDLAKANEDEVLRLWQGLGYYSRARNLHFTAKYIVNELGGVFPDTFTEIIKLKGIGDYTGAAIASFCFGEKVPVVDGNVIRVISRYFGITEAVDDTKVRKQIRLLCEEIISEKHPDIFNQAIMEFGALQCTPKQVNCEVCPLSESCFAYSESIVDKIPFKSKKIKKRTRYFYYLVVENNDKLHIQKRTGKDIWEGLYEFPFVEFDKSISEEEVLSQIELTEIEVNSVSTYVKHVLSHQTIFAKFFYIKSNDGIENTLKINKNSLDKYAFPQLIQNYINEYEF